MQKWKCTVCGYEWEGQQPPEKCPKCGSPSSAYVPEPQDPDVDEGVC